MKWKIWKLNKLVGKSRHSINKKLFINIWIASSSSSGHNSSSICRLYKLWRIIDNKIVTFDIVLEFRIRFETPTESLFNVIFESNQDFCDFFIKEINWILSIDIISEFFIFLEISQSWLKIKIYKLSVQVFQDSIIFSSFYFFLIW